MLQRDPDLLEHLEGCHQGPFEGVVHRVVWADKSSIQGSNGARGRWNSPDCQLETRQAGTELAAESSTEARGRAKLRSLNGSEWDNQIIKVGIIRAPRKSLTV